MATAPAAGGETGPTSRDGLQAISCPTTTTCAAVGGASSGTTSAALAELRESGTWRVKAVPLPTGTANSFLLGVSCKSPGACVAVGSYEDKNGLFFPLAEVWNGLAWSVETPPHPSGAPESQLSAVSCSSSRSCVAVGSWWTAHYVPYSFADSWNGTKWSMHATPQPSGAAYSFLTGVSCASSTACVAVGQYVDNQSVQRVLVEGWSGGKWTALRAPEPSGALSAQLLGVSCTAAASCIAVGGYVTGTKSPAAHPLVEAWDGQGWAVALVPEPPGTTAGALLGIWCVSAKDCEATGDATGPSGGSVTIAERWDGAKWSPQAPPPGPGGSASAALTGVSCGAANSCTASGAYGKTKGTLGLSFAERWNGSRWAVEVAPG